LLTQAAIYVECGQRHLCARQTTLMFTHCRNLME